MICSQFSVADECDIHRIGPREHSQAIFSQPFGDPHFPGLSDTDVTQDKSESPSGFDPDNPYALTRVEQQVVDLLISGLTGEEVAVCSASTAAA